MLSRSASYLDRRLRPSGQPAGCGKSDHVHEYTVWPPSGSFEFEFEFSCHSVPSLPSLPFISPRSFVIRSQSSWISSFARSEVIGPSSARPAKGQNAHAKRNRQEQDGDYLVSPSSSPLKRSLTHRLQEKTQEPNNGKRRSPQSARTSAQT